MQKYTSQRRPATEPAEDAILLVEDDPADVLLIRRAFRNAGIANRLYVVRDGEEAMQYLYC